MTGDYPQKTEKYLSVCGQSAEKFKCPSWKMKCALSFRKICLSTKNKLVTHFLLRRTQNLENVPWTWYSVTVCRSDRSVQCSSYLHDRFTLKNREKLSKFQTFVPFKYAARYKAVDRSLWLRLNYYTPKWGVLGSNEFHIKWIISTHGNWKNQNSGIRFWAIS